MLLFSHPLSHLSSSHERKSLSSCLSSTVPSVGLIQLSEADSHVDSGVNPRFYLPGWQIGGELGSKLRSGIAVLPERSLRHGSGQITYLECQLASLRVCRVCGGESNAFLHMSDAPQTLPVTCYLLSTNIIHTLFSTADLHSLGWFLQVPLKIPAFKICFIFSICKDLHLL